ncbi:Phosphoglucomutase [Sporotomaculum syntrophicum]|uniref:Phosphoglucomutase n=1 Tax=Sporotomaculum syntrophicum TaxID=182264 RepID=A0A9D2WSG0_9FIRM|nr:phosphoglucomutase/phosphomannomutase family protein [Sporotomaculum syntrophicum]KAF1086076.1 Phosphoglucomutase [Sporotomaculum syntrophicum]
MQQIKFGTDGWRGIIADDFTFENVRIVAQAVAEYVNGLDIGHKGIVVGYDNRFLSSRFADTIADVMVQNGIKVYLSNGPLPTPVTAFAVKVHDAAGAVMLTASHNPPEYNGFKFIPDYAGPALPHITEAIEENIARLQSGVGKRKFFFQEQSAELAPARPRVAERIMIDPRSEYFEHLEKLVDMKAIVESKLNIMVDAMHGSGIGYLDAMLVRAGITVEQRRCSRDPLFGGDLPEPTCQTLACSCDWVKEGHGRLGLAMDGDADRFGIIDSTGDYITPNQFFPVLYHHLITKKSLLGPVTRTVATTHKLDRIAEKHGQVVYETAVGFKYIGQNLLEKGCVLGCEESGGLSIKGHIPEKDGILAGLLAAEIVAVNRKSLAELARELDQAYGKLCSDRLDVHTTPGQKQDVLDKLKSFAPAQVAGEAVKDKITLDGLKLVLASGEWTLVRASGTEPLFRIYAEAGDEQRVQQIQGDMMQLIGLTRS